MYFFIYCYVKYFRIISVCVFTYSPHSNDFWLIFINNDSSNPIRVYYFSIKFFKYIYAGGAPLILAPLLVLIETVSYITRVISLGLRLAANISAGHLLFAILSGFAFNMLSNGLVILSLFPMLIMVFITLLEMMVAVIQAYVFCLLTTIYLGDTIALH